MLEVWFWIGSGRTFLTAISASRLVLFYLMLKGYCMVCPRALSLYTTPLSNVIRKHPGIHSHFYADDTQLYVHLTHKHHHTLAFERLKNCLDEVGKWLSVNKLKLNPDKTEFILFGSKNIRTKLGKFFPVSILGTVLSPVEAIRNLGVPGLILIFPSLAMLGISVRLVLFISGI